MPRVDVPAGRPAAANFTGSGTNNIISSPVTGHLYFVYVNETDQDISYIKSTNSGGTWSQPVAVLAGTYVQCSVWFDRWSGIAAGLIHVCGTNSADSDVDYRTINTESSDALGTQRVAFAGTSSAANPGGLSITRAQGGNIYVAYNIDGGTEHGMVRTVDGGANWTTRTTCTEAAAGDYFILSPGWASSDNQDIVCTFWDISAAELSHKAYDDSANSWAEGSMATTMTPGTAATAWPPFALCTYPGSNTSYVAAWSATDAANADLRAWIVQFSGASGVGGDIVLNSTDDQGLCAIASDASLYYVFYCGASNGSETFNTAMNVYYKSSGDGITWSAETALTTVAMPQQFLFVDPQPVNGVLTVAHSPSTAATFMNVEAPKQPRATLQLGI